jgi:prepilin-type N-terminal cleavage/methylation domain-containing protein
MRRRQAGFTLVELLVVIAVLGVLTTIAMTIYNNVQARSRVAKAEADTRTLSDAIGTFGAHMGQMPSALTDLTSPQTNVNGQVAGPFMASTPTPPSGWTYTYSAGGANGYQIVATGDSTTIVRP